ncbi:hypothetical protein SAMN05421738_12211 [Algoriella xinjiangensis]|uniref:Lipoprotein n=1 Tax=Algoriella xinjiangensis TaxID=684065 RepID=A0A1I5B6E2_9FLAO|nr:hypothetical protein [Algoriella xinjiangensis]SFN70276.1 hypothetical protein SAMN05421738_12211 [Algoriella xinjiangensis]VDH17604.1 Uncharacterised protein [Algoriella xinjiangensis]
MNSNQKIILKYLLVIISFVILVGCPSSVQVVYRPNIQLINNDGVYLYPLKNTKDTITLTCLYTKSYNQIKYKENIIVIITTSTNNNNTPVIFSSNNGKLKLYKSEENKKFFVLNDSINYKKIKIKNDSLNIKLDNSNHLLFLYKNN